MRSFVGMGLVWVAAAALGTAQERREETSQEILERIREILQESLHGEEPGGERAAPEGPLHRRHSGSAAERPGTSGLPGQELERWGEEFGRQWEDWGRRFEKEWSHNLESMPEDFWSGSADDIERRFEEWGEQYEREWEAWAEDYGQQWEEWGENYSTQWEAWAEDYGRQWEEWGEQMERLGEDEEALQQFLQDPAWMEGLFENLKGLEDMPLGDMPVPVPPHLGPDQQEILGKHLRDLNVPDDLLRRSVEELARDVAGASGDARKLLEEKRRTLKDLSSDQWKELEEQLRELRERQAPGTSRIEVERLRQERDELDARDAELEALRDEISQLRRELEELRSSNRDPGSRDR